jgi:hypothetical protein
LIHWLFQRNQPRLDGRRACFDGTTQRFQQDVPVGDNRMVLPLELLVSRAMFRMLQSLLAVRASHFKQSVPLAPLFVFHDLVFVVVRRLLLQSQRRGVLLKGLSVLLQRSF